MEVYTLPSHDYNPVKNYIRHQTGRIQKNSIFSSGIKFDRFDLIHVRNDLSMGLLAKHISQEWDIPFVHQISHLKAESLIEEYHRSLTTFTEWLKGQLGKRLRHTIANSADVLLPISEEMKNYLHDNEYQQQMEVLPTGAKIVEEVENPRKIREKYKIESEYLLVYIGSMAPIRRLEFLFDVLARVRREYDVTLLMMGGRSSNHRTRLEKAAEKKGVRSETIFTGWVSDRDEINSAISLADIGLSPFPTDSIVRTNAPIKTLEYMAVGTPIVASRTPDQEMVLNRSKAGVIASYDRSEFSQAIIDLLGNKTAREQMGEAGIQYLQSNRNFRVLTDRVEEIYTSVLTS
jgi:glycosyltransferase involved in cell wall biosynthesis